MAKKLGFIGAGNMAEAIIGGVIKAGVVAPSKIIASDMDKKRLALVAEKYNIETTFSNTAVAQSNMIFLSVKPHVYDAVIAEIQDYVNPDALVIILAAGLGIDAVAEKFRKGTDIKLVKVMPNTPTIVNCGMTAVCAAENVIESELKNVLKIFDSIGKTEVLPERLFDAFTAIASSSPAYAYMFIEAMADAGVKHGLSRSQAISISAQAVFGAASMVLKTGEHPATLRDAVCSPSGTTIEAVCELERQGFRNAIISAVTAAAEKYKDMKKI